MTDFSQQQRFYDELHESGGLRTGTAYLKWVLNQLRSAPNGGSLLDVGCGSGLFIDAARQAQYRAAGTDLSLVGLKWARGQHRNPVFLADGEHLPVGDSAFDIVTCLGSLEHFPDPARGVREISRVLSADGLAFIYLPNSRYALDLPLRLVGRSQSHDQPIEMFASRAEWRELLERNGFNVVATEKWNLNPSLARFVVRFGRIKGSILFCIWKIIRLMIPGELSYHFGFLCKKIAPGKNEVAKPR